MCNFDVEGIRLAEKEIGSVAAESCSMDSPAAPSPGSGDERGPRAKFLCSFGGSILPRPLDGRLRYVGGETRIVTVPRYVSYEDLLSRMREIFDGTSVIKYQQPDEDLDALVSVVNEDDVMNMMEEYDKLGSTSDGFTRLRILLFSRLPDSEAAAAHFDADERETERRYVDALNSLTDVKSQSPPLDFSDQYLNQTGLHHLNIPHPSHGNQLYGDVDSQWSPACFSPVRHGAHDHKDFPVSPSSSRYHQLGISKLSDQNPLQIDRQSPSVMENMVWLPPGAIIQEKSGFPSNIGYNHNNVYEGNPICENCHISFQRGQTAISNSIYLDPRWKHGQPHIDQPNTCAECYNNRDPYVLNQDMKLDHGVFMKEPLGHERSWLIHPHHNNPHLDDLRVHYIVESNAVNAPYGHGNFYEGNEVCKGQQAIGASSHMHIGGLEDNGVRYGNPSVYGADSFYQFQHNLPPLHLRRKAQAPLGPGTSYESPGLMVPNVAMGSSPVQGVQDGSPKPSGLGMDIQTQNLWAARNGDLVQRPSPLDYYYEHYHREKTNVFTVGGPPEAAYLPVVAPSVPNGNQLAAVYIPKEAADQNNVAIEKVDNLAEPAKERTDSGKVGDFDTEIADKSGDIQVENLGFLPELIASVKKAALEGAKEVKARAERDMDADSSVFSDHNKKESLSNEIEAGNVQAEAEAESDGDGENINSLNIEPTTAEAEALAKGLQTIKNDDLEEIRELGSGTYGAVYHGKWKGSDVAIKRIKASCFAGKPSERERLIADFWKEALILSSLHHPNVVSFYGVVRDGPDGSLATVTEFMVNGSLKQCLQKKDRTIDRRKRLIIAMDVAFGMEYLHGKNIVHFDLKCENLLVNMRDPHRPVCKIGDLGLSKVKKHTLVSGGVRGTLPWMAPELLSGKTNMVSEKIDVYSFGIVMWELLTGEEPYSDMRCASIIGGIVNNSLRPQIPSWCDPEWKSLMESCWSSDPMQRPSFSEIAQKLRKMAAAINVK